MSRGSRIAIFGLVVVGIGLVIYLTQDMQHTSRLGRTGRNGKSDVKKKTSNAGAGADLVRTAEFVGSEACKACHEDVYNKYKKSPMGRSMSVAEAGGPEDLEKARFVAADREYFVSKEGDALLHTERMFDGDDTLYEQRKEIAYVLGSGQRGRSYLIRDRDRLFQSSIGWYAQGGGKWDLSPGYDPEQHMRFSRVIGDGCLYCHAGRTNPKEKANDRYHEPAFLELSIGCERCHGPGKDHVAFHEASAKDGAVTDDPIVNPAKLGSPRLRDNVCNQCHLLSQSVIRRRNKEFFHFRPGQELEDTFVMLARPQGGEVGTIGAVTQVEQMQSSKCYQASEGKLGCTSCHDPHSSPEPEERVAYFRNQCMKCHEDQGCKLEKSARDVQQNSCIACHMPKMPTSDVPHTSLTHHGVIRPTDNMPLPDETSVLTVFGDGESRLASPIIDRARGIAMMTGAWSAQKQDLATEAMRLLVRIMPLGTGTMEERLRELNDTHVLEEMGSGYYLLEQPELAKASWERLLELRPENETALLGLAQVAWKERKLEVFEPLLDRVGKISPTQFDYLMMRLELSFALENPDDAVKWAEQLVQHHPDRLNARALLAEACDKAGRPEKAAEHRKQFERMLALKKKRAEARRSQAP